TKRDDSILAALSHIQITMDILQSKSEPNMMDSHIMDGFEIEFGFDDEDFEDINNWNVYDLDGNIEKSADRINQYNDFFTLLKIQEFGHTDTHIPVSELQNLDGKIELTGVQMDDLSGIEYCVNIQVVDFSDNHLTEITKLGYLNDLRELDLSQNNIDDISALSGLLQLESLDLAFNNIDNISKLFDLPALKYLNLIGNPVPIHQIEEIKKRSCMVVF
ncbi:MAG: leucine-rich repeat domain-containing protein, partial [Calditrichaceae bacterium]